MSILAISGLPYRSSGTNCDIRTGSKPIKITPTDRQLFTNCIIEIRVNIYVVNSCFGYSFSYSFSEKLLSVSGVNINQIFQLHAIYLSTYLLIYLSTYLCICHVCC